VLYVDGIREPLSFASDNTINTPVASDVTIGGAFWSDLFGYVGQMDELRIYGCALSQGEVAGLAGFTPGSSVTQPVQGLLSTIEDTDLVADGTVNFRDFAALLNAWLDEVLWP